MDPLPCGMFGEGFAGQRYLVTRDFCGGVLLLSIPVGTRRCGGIDQKNGPFGVKDTQNTCSQGPLRHRQRSGAALVMGCARGAGGSRGTKTKGRMGRRMDGRKQLRCRSATLAHAVSGSRRGGACEPCAHFALCSPIH